jgi:ribosomal-protein-alanine N-acetyltransferase
MATAPDLALPVPAVQMRPMNEADVGAVVAIEQQSYAFPWSEGIFRDCLRVGYLCCVVDLDGLVIGHGIMGLGAGEAHILNVCVRPEFRCRGVGAGLLQHLLDRGRAAGMTDAFLEVRPSNVAAIRLYRAFGFEQVGVRRGYYQASYGREDAAVLRLSLSPA